MKHVVIVAILLFPAVMSAAENESQAFKVIEVQQAGGFAGVNISYRITPDGKFKRKSRQGTVERVLSNNTSNDEPLRFRGLSWRCCW